MSYILQTVGHDAPREVRVRELDGTPRYVVKPHGNAARVSCPDDLGADLLEFLRASFDDFLDAGWPWATTWFLNDCPTCVAQPFEPCRSQTRARRAMRTVHRERWT